MIYAYIPPIAALVLAIRYVATTGASRRSRYVVAGVTAASLMVFVMMPAWRTPVVLFQVALGVYLIIALMVLSDGR